MADDAQVILEPGRATVEDTVGLDLDQAAKGDFLYSFNISQSCIFGHSGSQLDPEPGGTSEEVGEALLDGRQ